jgi:lipopolysaccharide export system protein LptA
MTMPRHALVVVLASGALASTVVPAHAQQPGAPTGVCQFTFEPRNPASPPRVNIVEQPGGTHNSYVGGGVRGRCPSQSITIVADSVEYYQVTKLMYLVGNVHYDEPRVKLAAQRVTYWQLEERLRAEGAVDATVPTGTNLKGPALDYYRAVPRVRPVARMIAPGRPTILIVERDSTGRPSEPVTVVANTVVMDADSLVYASGRVELTRPDVSARGDSAMLDNGRQWARLMRKPAIEGRGDRPFTLSGTVIDIYARNRALERAIASGAAKAVSQDATITSDTLDFRVRDGKLQQAYAWGKSRANAVAPTYAIDADSLDVRMPGQQMREVHAVGAARAESAPDSTKIRSRERDWLRGDTIIARFDTPAQRGDSAAQPQIRSLVAHGNAQSYYQLAANDTTSTLPALSYNRGRVIAIDFSNRQVQSVTIHGKVSGMYLEPGNPAAEATPARRGAPSRGSVIPQRRRPDRRD